MKFIDAFEKIEIEKTAVGVDENNKVCVYAEDGTSLLLMKIGLHTIETVEQLNTDLIKLFAGAAAQSHSLCIDTVKEITYLKRDLSSVALFVHSKDEVRILDYLKDSDTTGLKVYHLDEDYDEFCKYAREQFDNKNPEYETYDRLPLNNFCLLVNDRDVTLNYIECKELGLFGSYIMNTRNLFLGIY